MTGKVLTPAEAIVVKAEMRWLSSFAFNHVGDYADFYNSVHDLETLAISQNATIARLRGLIEGMECQVWCAKYDYFGVSCEKCGIGEVHARGPLCPEDGKPHNWVTVAQKPCNCVKSQVEL